MGAAAHNTVTEYIQLVQPGAVIEMGCSPPGEHENSTEFFIDYFRDQKGYTFYAVDIDSSIIDKLSPIAAKNSVITCGQIYDIKLHEKVCFAYLDGFDFLPPGCEWHDWVEDQIKKYEDLGHKLTKNNSASSHLRAAKYVSDHAADKCIIIFDDTYLIEETQTHAGGIERGKAHGLSYPSSGWYGKGQLAVPWLLAAGWQILPKVDTERDDWTVLGKNI